VKGQARKSNASELFLVPLFILDLLCHDLTAFTDPSYAISGGRQQEDARQTLLSQILLPDAADRLGRIRMVKESRATDVENRLIMLAQTGQLRAKVTEEQLIDLLNKLAENKEEAKIVISRRKGGWDDDDDLLDL